MKISAWHKQNGDDVVLKTDYNSLDQFDKVYISKVFTDTVIPCEPEDKSGKGDTNISEWYSDNELLNRPNVVFGGTGFYYDKAPPLPQEIEHIMPDYHLYDEWVSDKLSSGASKKDTQYYTDFSIGFTTRGCFRRCSFCVNRNYDRCFLHSPIEEFFDKNRRYICLLDDNVFSCSEWASVFKNLQATKKRFQFKQGLDIRLITDEKCDALLKSRWIDRYIFAFDNINDSEIIKNRLMMLRKYTDKIFRFYCFCGFNNDSAGQYSEDFWVNDIKNLFERISILMENRCIPYIMRYKDYILSPYSGVYIIIAAWCNQPNIFTKMSLREYCVAKGRHRSAFRYLSVFEERYPEFSKYFDMKFSQIGSKKELIC